MANTKKDLVNTAKKLIDDIFDHYDDYSVDDKQKVQCLMNQMAELNLSLDLYDKVKKTNKNQTLWGRFRELVGDFFGKE